MNRKAVSELNREGEYPKMDCTGVLPDNAELFEGSILAGGKVIPPDGEVLLAMDKEGNVFNLGNDVTLYVADIDQDDQDS